MQVTVREAKTKLSKLLERVEKGQKVIIARRGKPVAQLLALPLQPSKPVLGTAAGKIILKKGWDDPMTLNVHEAKVSLPKLLEKPGNGKKALIARRGKPVAKRLPITLEPSKRVLGAAAGKIILKKGWDDPMTDEEYREFLGG